MKGIIYCIIVATVVMASSCARCPLSSSGIAVSVADVSAAGGEKVAVPINIDTNSAGILGIDLQLAYNPAHLQFVNAVLGGLTQQWNIVSKMSDTQDKVTIGLYGSTALSAAKGSIAVVNFIVKPEAPAGATSALHLRRADFNEKPAAKKKDGKLAVVKQ